jgi:hypothetical protein
LAGWYKEFTLFFKKIIIDYKYCVHIFSCSIIHHRILKKGLLHAHILIFLKDKTICHDASMIDIFISAEISNKEIDPIGYTVVQNYMIHGPCGELNTNSVCMECNKCTKHFPRRFNPETTIDEEGFSVYRRCDDGKHIKKGKVEVDNRFVVPYNKDLLVEFDAHINVEWCNMSRSVKFLFKNIHKGVDYICGVLKQKGLNDDQVDEIKKY